MTDLRDTSRDERLLAAHGYRQELERGLSLWSSFSVASPPSRRWWASTR